MSLVVYAWSDDTCEVEEYDLELVADPSDWPSTMKEAFHLMSAELDLDDDLEITNSRTQPGTDGVMTARFETGLPDGGGAASIWHLYVHTTDTDAAGELADNECEAFSEGRGNEDDEDSPDSDGEEFEEDDEDMESSDEDPV